LLTLQGAASVEEWLPGGGPGKSLQEAEVGRGWRKAARPET
jgi:hypothetical protein